MNEEECELCEKESDKHLSERRACVAANALAVVMKDGMPMWRVFAKDCRDSS